MLGAILSILLTGFVIGGLARWAVPGPDPMSIWMTIALGVAGSLIGGGIAAAIFGTAPFPILLFSVAAATLLLIGHRKFVQKRPITGSDAHRPPPPR